MYANLKSDLEHLIDSDSDSDSDEEKNEASQIPIKVLLSPLSVLARSECRGSVGETAKN